MLPFTPTWMDLEGIMLSEIRLIKNKKYRMISLIRGNFPPKRKSTKLTDPGNRLVVARGRE